MSVKLKLVQAANLPSADINGLSDPYLKIFINGPNKTYVAKTKVISKTINPYWDEEFTFSSVRGLRFVFHVFDHDDIGKDGIIAIGKFDPLINEINKPQRIPLTKVSGKGGEHASMLIMVQVQPMKKPIAQKPTIFNAPVYITVEPDQPFLPPTPISKDPEAPFPFPFQLAIIAFSKTSNACRVINIDNRYGAGCLHSGNHACFSINTFTQTIRLDPAVAAQQGFTDFYIVLHTQNFDPLYRYFTSANVTFWTSREKPKALTRGSPYRFEGMRDAQLDGAAALSTGYRCPFDIPPEATLILMAVGQVSGQNVIFQPIGNFYFPSKANPITPQTPHEVIQPIMKNLNPSAQYDAVTVGVPHCSPVSLSRIVSIAGPAAAGPPAVIEGKSAGITQHNFMLYYLLPNSNLHDAKLIQAGSFRIDLGSVPAEAACGIVVLTGAVPLAAEGKDKKGLSLFAQNEALAPTLRLTLNSSLMLCEHRLPNAKDAQHLIWFAFFRDPFGGWSLVNLKRPVVLSPNTNPEEFHSIMCMRARGILLPMIGH